MACSWPALSLASSLLSHSSSSTSSVRVGTLVRLTGRSLSGCGLRAGDTRGSSCREPELLLADMAISSVCDISTLLPGTITNSELSAWESR